MSLVKKGDVKDHLSRQHQKRIHLNWPLSQPDAPGFSREPAPARTDSNMEVQHREPFSIELEAPPLVTSPDSGNTGAPTLSKSAQP